MKFERNCIAMSFIQFVIVGMASSLGCIIKLHTHIRLTK